MKQVSLWLRIWRWYAFMSGVAVITMLLAYLILWASAITGSVVKYTGDFHLMTPEVQVGGAVRYRYDAERFASCPGFVLTTLRSVTNHGPAAIVPYRRPVLATEIKPIDDFRGEIPLSESVFPGTWLVEVGVDSQCPTFQRYDKLVEFQIKVVPK